MRIWLIYPINDEFKENEEICFKSDDGVLVKVIFVDCHHIEFSLKERLWINVKSKYDKHAVQQINSNIELYQ